MEECFQNILLKKDGHYGCGSLSRALGIESRYGKVHIVGEENEEIKQEKEELEEEEEVKEKQETNCEVVLVEGVEMVPDEDKMQVVEVEHEMEMVEKQMVKYEMDVKNSKAEPIKTLPERTERYRDPEKLKETRERMQKAYTLAVESFLKGEQNISATTKRFGLKRGTFIDWIKARKEGRTKVWKNRGQVSKVFLHEEEEIIRDIVNNSDTMMTFTDLQVKMQDILLTALALNPERKTGYENVNQLLPRPYMYGWARRHKLSDRLRVTLGWKLENMAV